MNQIDLAGKRIAVTGGTGMIGQCIVRQLVEADADVTMLSRRGARDGNPQGDRIASAQADITDPASLDFTDFDLVVHGAAFVAFGLTPEKEALLMKTNVEGTQNVLDAAARDGVEKVVHVSSVAALGTTFGEPRGEDWFHERPHEFNSAYEESKFRAHGVVLAEDRVATAAVMPSVVLGLGESSSGRLLVAYLNRKIPVKPDHPGRIGVVHVEDVAAGTLAALREGSGAYVLNEADLTLPQLFDVFEESTGVPAPRRVVPFGVLRAGAAVSGLLGKISPRLQMVNPDTIRSLQRDSQFDATRARTELGWNPDMRTHLMRDAATFGL